MPATLDRAPAADRLIDAPGEPEESTPIELDRRGPLRPEHLVTARRRLRGEVIAYSFCAIDALLLVLTAAWAFELDSAGLQGAAKLALATPFAGAALLALVSLRAVRAFGFRIHERPIIHMARIAFAMIAAAVFLDIVLIVARGSAALINGLRGQIELSAAAVFCAHLLWLALIGRWRRRGLLTPNIVVVGANHQARQIIERALKTGEAAVLGVFDDRHRRTPRRIAGVPVLGDTQALIRHRIMPYVDRVVIAVDPAAKARVGALVGQLAVLPNDITLFVDWSAVEDTQLSLDQLVDTPLSRLSGRRGGYRRLLAKRLQDLVFGALALALAAPVMLLIAVAIKLDSPGPVFFRQRRHGFNNEDIVVWKFRSMRDELRDENASQQVSSGDRRVSRVGRLIRATSLDELPQLFNVLSGEMSLVGPRPHAPGMKTGELESSKLIAHYAHRHRIKPGMTGWAAIHGSRGPLDDREKVLRRVALDMAYIERQSFWLDLYIMLMTLPCLLGDRLNPR